MGASAAALQRGSLSIREPAPDPVLLVRVHRELEARCHHRAVPAHGFCMLFARVFLYLRLRLVGSEENLNAVLAAKSFFLPVQLFD